MGRLYPEFDLDFYRLILHENLFGIFGSVLLAVGAIGTLGLWLLAQDRFKCAFFSLAIYIADWPVFVIYLYENQRRGVYPPEADTIFIPIYQSYLACLVLFPVFWIILILSSRAPSWTKRSWRWVVTPLLALFWLGYGSMRACEWLDSLVNDHPFGVLYGMVSISSTFIMLWPFHGWGNKRPTLPSS